MIPNTTIDVTQVIPTDKKRNHHINKDEQHLASTYSDSATSFSYKKSQEQSANKNYNTIHDLELAHGLIDLLIKNKYTLPSLMSTDPSELPDVLAIDQEVAKIICAAAKKKNNRHRKMR